MSVEAALGIGTAIAGIAGNAMNIAATNNLNGRNRRWQESMWNKQNEYNTPLAQRHRLEEAGINPFSVLAQGGADSGQAGSVGTPNTFQQHQIDGAGLFGAAMQAAMNKKMMRKQDLENENLGIQNQYARDREIISLMEQRARIEKDRMEADKNSSEKKMLDLEYDSLNSRLQSLVTQSEQEARILTMVADNKQRELEDAHNESVVRQELASANIQLSKSQMAHYLADIRRIHEEVELLKKQGKLTDKEAELVEKQKLTEVTREVVMRHDSARREGVYYRGMLNNSYEGLYGDNNAGGSSLEGGIVGSIVTSLLSRGMGSSTVVRGFGR